MSILEEIDPKAHLVLRRTTMASFPICKTTSIIANRILAATLRMPSELGNKALPALVEAFDKLQALLFEEQKIAVISSKGFALLADAYKGTECVPSKFVKGDDFEKVITIKIGMFETLLQDLKYQPSRYVRNEIIEMLKSFDFININDFYEVFEMFDITESYYTSVENHKRFVEISVSLAKTLMPYKMSSIKVKEVLNGNSGTDKVMLVHQIFNS